MSYYSETNRKSILRNPLALLAVAALLGASFNSVLAADKFDSYYKSASDAKDLNLAARYTVGALQEARKFRLADPLQKSKYIQLEKLAEAVYKKCKTQKNYEMALAVAQQGLVTGEVLNGKNSPELLKYLFFIENTLGARDARHGSNQLFRETEPYYERALDIGEKIPALQKKDAYKQQHEYAYLLTAILKDYMTTLKILHRDSDLAALQKRIDKMPVFSDGNTH